MFFEKNCIHVHWKGKAGIGHLRDRSGYLPNIAVNSVEFITIYRTYRWSLLARSSAVGGVRRVCHALFTIYLPVASYVRL